LQSMDDDDCHIVDVHEVNRTADIERFVR